VRPLLRVRTVFLICMCYLPPWQFHVIICLSSTDPKILTYRCFCSSVPYSVVVKQTESHVFMTARIFVVSLEWWTPIVSCKDIGVCMARMPEEESQNRVITVLPWWLSTDLSSVQGLHYHVNHQGVFVMDCVDICGWLWKYVNKISNLLKA